MSNLRNLLTAEAKYKGVSVVHDMTMKERQLNKEQIRMAKEKKDENESGGLHIHSAGTTVGKDDSQCQSQKVNREKSCVYNENINMLQKDKHHVDNLKVFNCIYTNADSLPKKLDELKARIQYSEGNMDIIGITEINPKIADTTLERQNYR